MIKGINRELGELVAPSFLLEVMAQDIVKAPFGRYQDEVVLFLATAAERINEVWPDPAGLGGDVNTVMGQAQKLLAAQALSEAQLIAERAVDLEDENKPGSHTTNGRSFSATGSQDHDHRGELGIGAPRRS
jgi:hypothetical protein